MSHNPRKDQTVFYCSKVGDVPQHEHFAILKNRSVSYNGGHGYGQMTDQYMEYVAYTVRSEWEEAIRLETSTPFSQQFRAFHVLPAKVNIHVSVSTPEIKPVFPQNRPL